MIAIIIGAWLYALGIAWLAYELLTAPLGFQDERGFHPINMQTRVASERGGSCPTAANPGGGASSPSVVPTPLKTPEHEVRCG